MENHKLIVDLDGTVFHQRFPNIGAPIPGAIAALRDITLADYEIVIYSCRNNPKLYRFPEDRDRNLQIVKSAFDAAEFPQAKIDDGTAGKPIGEWYVDDQGLPFTNWVAIIDYLKARHDYKGNSNRPRINISVGIEGCILDSNNELIEDSKAALSYLIRHKYRVILSTRYSNRELIDSARVRTRKLSKIKATLKSKKIPFHWFDEGLQGKPVADYYIEENMLPFNGSWSQILEHLEVEKIFHRS